VIVAQLVNLQIINGEYYDEQSQTKLLAERDIIAPRGKLSTGTEYPSLSIEWICRKNCKTGMTEKEKNE